MYVFISSIFRILSRCLYTYTFRELAEGKLSRAARSGVGRYFRDEVTQGPRQTFSLLLNGVCISRPRKSRRRDGAGVYTFAEHTYTWSYSRINKEVGIHGYARAQANTRSHTQVLLRS